jgi:hypothetical protein
VPFGSFQFTPEEPSGSGQLEIHSCGMMCSTVSGAIHANVFVFCREVGIIQPCPASTTLSVRIASDKNVTERLNVVSGD